jgi:hypothetical protein
MLSQNVEIFGELLQAGLIIENLRKIEKFTKMFLCGKNQNFAKFFIKREKFYL